VDYAVIEAGLGGRLDATNIVCPLVSAISPISYDHTDVLGNNLGQIAREKCGIIKKEGVCVSAPQEKDVFDVIVRRCRSQRAELVFVKDCMTTSLRKDATRPSLRAQHHMVLGEAISEIASSVASLPPRNDEKSRFLSVEELCHDSEKEIFTVRGMLREYANCESRLLGRHQTVNATCAVGIAESLIKKGVKISPESIKKGIEKTENPARCEVREERPLVVFDGAQNRASAAALKETVKRNFRYKNLILVLGISKDKDIKGICEELIPLAEAVILTKAASGRGADPGVIEKFIKDKKTIPAASVMEAMHKARRIAAEDDMILVTGSFFVIGEAGAVHK
jgi:dihydrofolate synthase/folylpolyglutamate synthase